MEQTQKVKIFQFVIFAIIFCSQSTIFARVNAQEVSVLHLQEGGLPSRFFRIPASALNELIRQPGQFFKRFDFDRQFFVPQQQQQQQQPQENRNQAPQQTFQPPPQSIQQVQRQPAQTQSFIQDNFQPQFQAQPVQNFNQNEPNQQQQQQDFTQQFQSPPPPPPPQNQPIQQQQQQPQQQQQQQQQQQPQQQQSQNQIQSRPVRQQPMTEVCLACICQASTGCNLTTPCVSGGQYCGPFLISKPYWLDAGMPVLLGDQATRSGAFEDCALDPVCSAETVRSYMTKYMKDCNNDGRIDCDDLGRIHLMGSFGCADPSVTQTPFYQRFSTCVAKASKFSSS